MNNTSRLLWKLKHVMSYTMVQTRIISLQFIPFVQPPFRIWPNFVSKMHWDIGNLSKAILTYPHLFHIKSYVCTFYVHLCIYACKFLLMYILLVWIKLSILIEQQGLKKVSEIWLWNKLLRNIEYALFLMLSSTYMT